jgi:hypothetical protein
MSPSLIGHAGVDVGPTPLLAMPGIQWFALLA